MRRSTRNTTSTGLTTTKPSLFSRMAGGSRRPAGTTSSNGAGVGSTTSGRRGIRGRKQRTVGTGPMPMSHHKPKATVGMKIHGAARVLKGKLTGRPADTVSGEKMMHGDMKATTATAGTAGTAGTRKTKRF